MTRKEEKLFCGDCYKQLAELPERSIQLVLCDPPYGVTNNPNDKKLDWERIWPLIWRVCKPNAAVVLFGQGVFSAELIMSQRKQYRYSMVWDKQLCTGHLNAKRMPLRRHEDILVFSRKQPVYHPQMRIGKACHSVGKAAGTVKKSGEDANRNYKTNRVVQTEGNKKYPQSILSFQKPHSSIAVHPTEKPVKLLEYLIRTYSDPGDAVLDFCMGSGSTGVAAIQTGREFVGIELNESYYLTAKRRIRAAYYQESMFELMEG